MRAQRHQRGDAYQRVATLAAITTGPTEVAAVLRGIGNSQRRAVDAIRCQSTPRMLAGAIVSPLVRAHLEQHLQRLCAHARSRLRHCAGCHGGSSPRQHQIQPTDQVMDWPLPKHRHPDYQPDDLLS